MTADSRAVSPDQNARVAGAIYLAVIVAGLFTEVVHSVLIEKGDAAASAANILGAQTLFRLAFASDVVGVAGYAVVTVLLYGLLLPVDRTGSRLAMVFGLLGCAALASTLLFSLAPLFLLGGAHYLAPFRPDQLQALVLLSMKLYGLGYTVGMVFFGLYGCVLGGLIWRSGFLPCLIGLALAIAGVADLIDSFSYFISPALSEAISSYTFAPALVGEGSLCVWLLVAGVDTPRWIERARGWPEAAALGDGGIKSAMSDG